MTIRVPFQRDGLRVQHARTLNIPDERLLIIAHYSEDRQNNCETFL